jgi:hypothetical protein
LAWWGVLGDGVGRHEIVTLAEVREKRQHAHHISPHRFRDHLNLQNLAHDSRRAASSSTNCR